MSVVERDKIAHIQCNPSGWYAVIRCQSGELMTTPVIGFAHNGYNIDPLIIVEEKHVTSIHDDECFVRLWHAEDMVPFVETEDTK